MNSICEICVLNINEGNICRECRVLFEPLSESDYEFHLCLECEYCDKYCHGVLAEFARAFGRLPQNVTPIFNSSEKWRVIFEGDKHLLVQVKEVRYEKRD